MNEKTVVEIERRKLELKLEGMTELEVAALVKMVNETFAKVKAQNNVADTSKLALYVALNLADELYKLQNASRDRAAAVEHKLEQFAEKLKTSLLAAGFQAP